MGRQMVRKISHMGDTESLDVCGEKKGYQEIWRRKKGQFCHMSPDHHFACYESLRKFDDGAAGGWVIDREEQIIKRKKLFLVEQVKDYSFWPEVGANWGVGAIQWEKKTRTKFQKKITKEKKSSVKCHQLINLKTPKYYNSKIIPRIQQKRVS